MEKEKVKKIHFVEDDTITGSLITRGLQEAGHEVCYMNSLVGFEEALHAYQPDLLLLDLEIGNQNSLDKIPSIHSKYPSLPILIASSHNDGDEIARCIRLGAESYIKKPYEIKEILALIDKYCPDPTLPNTACIPIGSYYLDTQTHTLHFPDHSGKKLTPKEYQLLKQLEENSGKVVTRVELLELIWKNQEANESLNNNIVSLRSLLKQDTGLEIQTVKGVGYRLIGNGK